MVILREEKIQRIMHYIPEQKIEGEKTGDLLVVGWGGTYGALISAVKELQKEGKRISLAQFNYIKPLPKNTAEIFKGFKTLKYIVCLIDFSLHFKLIYVVILMKKQLKLCMPCSQ